MSNYTNIHLYNDRFSDLGSDAFKIIQDLFPICRSITGPGNRQTLDYISNIIPLNRYSYNSGEQCFGWQVPQEWSLDYAKISDLSGNTIVSSEQSNLHVLNYSEPFSGTVDLNTLKQHLYFREDLPDVVPYVTSYYNNRWGFSISYDHFKQLKDEFYVVDIDSKLYNGKLDFADAKLNFGAKKDILISTYFCHPSLANDNLSGVALSTVLYKELSKYNSRRYNYRFIFVPETIGCVAYLNKFKDEIIENTYCGLVATCVGDNLDEVTYKKTKNGMSDIDRATINLLKNSQIKHKVIDFVPIGSDERQYNSPGFNLNVGSLMRTYYYDFKYYHTSKDNLDIISKENLGKMIELYLMVFDALEKNYKWVRKDGGFGEPQLGKLGLYPTLGAQPYNRYFSKNISWALSLADGNNDTISISDKSGMSFDETYSMLENLEKLEIVERV